MSETQQVKQEPIGASNAYFRFSPRILDNLGVSAYNSVAKCLVELAANAYDADATSIHVRLPDVIDDNSVIEVLDDGNGMLSEDLREKYLFIGRNRRSEGQVTPKGRQIIGSKGIGKLAGFGIASRINLITWRDGNQASMTLDRSMFDDLKSLSELPIKIVECASEHPNGTQIRLMSLNSELSLPSADTLRQSLFRALPKKTDFSIQVNGVNCTAEDVAGQRYDFSEEVEGLGLVSGYYIVAATRQSSPGLQIRVRERVVTEPSLFGIDTRAHGFFTAEKIVGEINASFLDPVEVIGSGRDLINISRDGFLSDSSVIQTLYAWAKAFLEKTIRGIDEQQQRIRTSHFLESPEIKERLQSLPPHIRGTATKVVSALALKLKNVEDKEALEMLEWVLRYYESNVLRELLNTIIASDPADAERLAGLVKDWGLRQVSSVAEQVKNQIDIIGKLEELIVSEKAREIDLHNLIETNLWLVRPGLEVWSSDKTLKQIMDNHISEIYEKQKHLRPDLICRSRDNGNDAVIIEFKRPTEKITNQHVTQALTYASILKKHLPSIHFVTYVVGREYDPAVLAVKDNLEKASLYFWSFGEILQAARMRFEKILDILGK